MAVDVTLYAKTVTFGLGSPVTWDTDSGGPIAVRLQHEGTIEEVRTGADEYSKATFITDKSCRVFVSLVEFKITSVNIGDGPADITLTLNDGTSDTTVTIANMVLYAINPNQTRAVSASTELAFVHESADGTTDPIS